MNVQWYVRQNLTLEIRVVTVPCQNELKNISIVKSWSEGNPVPKKVQLLEIDCFHMSSTLKSISLSKLLNETRVTAKGSQEVK